MKLFLDGHSLEYEMRALCTAFFPGVHIECEQNLSAAADMSGGDFVYSKIKKRGNGFFSALICVCINGVKSCSGDRVNSPAGSAGHDFDKQCEFALGRAMYKAAVKLTGIKPPWGILTGIRPVKLARQRLAGGMSQKQAADDLMARYYLSENKAELCVESAAAEKRITALSKPNSTSLYISIPFCPSRCLYCSFISHDVKKSAKLLPEYVRLLCLEIEKTGELAARLGLNLETVYIGGGTPTTLSAEQISSVMESVKKSFNINTVREYTVEAGRPDTITREKLDAIQSGGATRISINPQTLNDGILRDIGRCHTSEQVFSAFYETRRAGNLSINMDLIAGLPGDTPDGFARTLGGVLSLDPEAVTIHTLAMKRSSRLVTSGNGIYDARAEDVNTMLDCAGAKLAEKGYFPYYLYRQRNTLGGLENTGFAKAGHEGLYNIFIMDETHTVLAAGASGVTKLRQPGGNRIERVFNFKYPYEYISRFSEIIDRKKKVNNFYAYYNKNIKQSQSTRQ